MLVVMLSMLEDVVVNAATPVYHRIYAWLDPHTILGNIAIR